MTEAETRQNGPMAGKTSDHFANERTYLAWLRTGIATIGLGFVVAKFGLALRTITGVSAIPETSYSLSSAIGVALCITGGIMTLIAFTRFRKNRERIILGNYEPSITSELVISSTLFVIAILLVAYLLFTF